MNSTDTAKKITLQFEHSLTDFYDANRLSQANTNLVLLRRGFPIALWCYILCFFFYQVSVTLIYLLSINLGLSYPLTITEPITKIQLIVGDQGFGDSARIAQLASSNNLLQLIFLIAASLFVWFDVLGRALAWIAYRKNSKLFTEPIILTLNESGIAYTQQHLNSEIEWSFYNGFKENSRLFILLYGNGLYSTIPKRAFASQSEVDFFREILSRKIVPPN